MFLKGVNHTCEKTATKTRRCLSAVVSGKAIITKPEVHAKIVEHKTAAVKNTKEPTAGPSRLQTPHLYVVLPL